LGEAFIKLEDVFAREDDVASIFAAYAELARRLQ
jgi:hypothetical protein